MDGFSLRSYSLFTCPLWWSSPKDSFPVRELVTSQRSDTASTARERERERPQQQCTLEVPNTSIEDWWPIEGASAFWNSCSFYDKSGCIT
ncbi:hypothetical protein TNCV_97431 [Trichonephila clavipes]|nr:hypothetical protein TNCV_97431 [Trichonephila clavipes]